MTVELFLSLLVISATATSIAVQIVKSLLNNAGVTYKSVSLATIVATAVGIIEIFVYYETQGLAVTFITVIYAICMGIANAIGSTTEYDLVKKFILAITNK